MKTTMNPIFRKMTTFALLAGLTLGWTSCSKDDEDGDNGVKPKTKTELLTTPTWKMSGLKIDPPMVLEDTTISDLLVNLPCMQDDNMKYTATENGKGTYREDEGATKCDEEDPQSTNGDWSFNTSETKLTIKDSDGEVTDVNINALTESKLELSSPIQLENPETGEVKTHTLTASYTAQ